MALSRDAVVDAAIDITRSAGLSAVTMRAVAARFDVTAMALYRHVADREELVRLVADRIGELIHPQTPPDASWEQRARDWAMTQHEVLRRHPGVAAWLIDNGPAGPQAYRLLELLVATLSDAGFDDATVARGAAAITSWTFTRVAIEDSADVRVRRRASNRAAAFVDGLTGVDAAAHPTATRVGREFFTLPLPELFRGGLDLILAGLRSQLDR
ncbi:TetR/AcrR family transcriptional regulator [Micromonospora craniellae]|uniref:TetR/AcrR family transcriptional regulator n=1 Tax=Micromonospora craniellae TaxID=2294034 RepID=UPI001313D9BF|nr:TetR/AcrR family transcriptional regulator C-terminal domain-containing protein [Micromonospora craniellae]QOC93450.1 TetR/AcrR family transcriptional regulator C-terminal domain-containing protein [Micromonospora craniellae]